MTPEIAIAINDVSKRINEINAKLDAFICMLDEDKKEKIEINAGGIDEIAEISATNAEAIDELATIISEMGN